MQIYLPVTTQHGQWRVNLPGWGGEQILVGRRKRPYRLAAVVTDPVSMYPEVHLAHLKKIDLEARRVRKQTGRRVVVIEINHARTNIYAAA